MDNNDGYLCADVEMVNQTLVQTFQGGWVAMPNKRLEELDNPFMNESEKTIVKGIKKMLDKEFPGVWYKIHGGPYQEAGIPDIIGCYNGHFIGLEVKTPDKANNVSERQQYQIERLRNAGARVEVVVSVKQAWAFMATFGGKE
jgi:hypothetical protein